MNGRAGWLAVTWAALVVGPAWGEERAVPGARQADIHNPFSPSYHPLTPNQFTFPDTPGVPPATGNPAFVYPWLGWYPYGYPYGYAYPYGAWPGGPYATAPLEIPAEELFGPQAARRFLGAGPSRSAPARDEVHSRTTRSKVRPTNEEVKARASRTIGAGNALFAKGRYRDALTRYRGAAETAPDLPEAHFHQGHALVAVGSYAAAVKAFRRGLALDQDWPRWPVDLAALYAGNQQERRDHLEALAVAAEKNPQDAGLVLLIGLQLWAGGEAERALVFFRRCEQLGGNEDGVLDGLLRSALARK